MYTTFGGDFNALRSPETAPRDVMILGRFANEGFAPAIWGIGAWVVPKVVYEVFPVAGRKPSFFDTRFLRADALTGWLPLPTIAQAVGRAS